MNEKLKRVCRNYNAIVNCEFMEDDLFSHYLVQSYKHIISEIDVDDETQLLELAKFDYVVRRYIEDYNFSDKLQQSIDINDIVNYKGDISLPLLQYLSQFSDKYDDEKSEIITNTKWI